MKYSPTQIARQFSFVREITQNKGRRVESIQHWSGGQPGDSWCCEFATFILDICYQGKSPVPLLGSVQSVYDLAREKKWITDSPVIDDLFIYVNDVDHAHHIGIYTGDNTGISGNTSPDGLSSNGSGVFEHELTINPRNIKYIHYQ